MKPILEILFPNYNLATNIVQLVLVSLVLRSFAILLSLKFALKFIISRRLHRIIMFTINVVILILISAMEQIARRALLRFVAFTLAGMSDESKLAHYILVLMHPNNVKNVFILLDYSNQFFQNFIKVLWLSTFYFSYIRSLGNEPNRLDKIGVFLCAPGKASILIFIVLLFRNKDKNKVDTNFDNTTVNQNISTSSRASTAITFSKYGLLFHIGLSIVTLFSAAGIGWLGESSEERLFETREAIRQLEMRRPATESNISRLPPTQNENVIQIRNINFQNSKNGRTQTLSQFHMWRLQKVFFDQQNIMFCEIEYIDKHKSMEIGIRKTNEYDMLLFVFSEKIVPEYAMVYFDGVSVRLVRAGSSMHNNVVQSFFVLSQEVLQRFEKSQSMIVLDTQFSLRGSAAALRALRDCS